MVQESKKLEIKPMGLRKKLSSKILKEGKSSHVKDFVIRSVRETHRREDSVQ